MPEINLLPDELRGKEEKELKSVRKKPKRIRIDMSSPKRDVVEQPLKQSRPSLISRLFTKKTKPGAKIAADREQVKPKTIDNQARAVEKTVHIPKAKGGGLLLPRIKKPSITSVGGKEADAVDDDRAASFITEEETKGEKVKISKRSEKVIEDIQKSPRQKRGWLLRLFSRDKGTKKKKPVPSGKISTEEPGAKPKPDSQGGDRDTVVDVDLIPEELKKHPELEVGKKLFSSGVVLGIFVLLILIGYFGIAWYQLSIATETQKVEDEIKLVDARIAEFEKNRTEAREFQQYLTRVKQLLDNHIYWSKFFEKLEQHTSREVFYSNFSMAGTEKLTISATTKDYEAIAEQLVAFEEADDFIQDARITAATAVIDPEDGSYRGINFTISLDFVPGVFLSKQELP